MMKTEIWLSILFCAFFIHGVDGQIPKIAHTFEAHNLETGFSDNEIGDVYIQMFSFHHMISFLPASEIIIFVSKSPALRFNDMIFFSQDFYNAKHHTEQQVMMISYDLKLWLQIR